MDAAVEASYRKCRGSFSSRTAISFFTRVFGSGRSTGKWRRSWSSCTPRARRRVAAGLSRRYSSTSSADTDAESTSHPGAGTVGDHLVQAVTS